MGLRNWLFGNDDGCTGHQYEVDEFGDMVRVRAMSEPEARDNPGYFKVQRTATFECVHHGCERTKKSWKTIGYVDHPDIVFDAVDDVFEEE